MLPKEEGRLYRAAEKPWLRLVWVLLIGCLLPLVGCGRAPVIEGRYGESSARGNSSLNGYSSLRRMFRSYGYSTFSARSLSASMEKMDVLIWTPDTNTPPSIEARNFIEEWLAAKPGRTLVYVGRDFESSVAYWNNYAGKAEPGNRVRYYREEMLSRSALDKKRTRLTSVTFARWFSIDPNLPYSKVEGLDGEWADGIDSSKTDLWIGTELRQPNRATEGTNPSIAASAAAAAAAATAANGGFPATPPTTPPAAPPAAPNSNTTKSWWTEDEIYSVWDEEWEKIPQSETLLSADDGRALVQELSWYSVDKSKILVVTNGCFLQNGGLVMHEHRKLAGKLIEACAIDGKTEGKVAFLLSDEQGPRVTSGEEADGNFQGLEIFRVWPVNLILCHGILIGILLCFRLLPVLGRPKDLPPRPTSDFGDHIEAIGNLLARSGDEVFARRVIANYFVTVRGEPGSPWAQAPVPLQAPVAQMAPFAQAVSGAQPIPGAWQSAVPMQSPIPGVAPMPVSHVAQVVAPPVLPSASFAGGRAIPPVATPQRSPFGPTPTTGSSSSEALDAPVVDLFPLEDDPNKPPSASQ